MNKVIATLAAFSIAVSGTPAMADDLDSRLQLIAEAQPDECFYNVGDSTPIDEEGLCERELLENGESLEFEIGIPKTNEAYVWSLASSRGHLWFGTGANVNCLVGGLYLGTSAPSRGQDSVCEYGDSSYQPIAFGEPGLPAGFGDWRPPKIYSVDQNRPGTEINQTAQLTGLDLVRLNQTVGLRAAGILNDELVYLAGPSFLGGINVFVFSAVTDQFLGSRYLAQYSNIRNFKPFKGALVAGVAKAQGKGALLAFTGTEETPFAFEEVLEVEVGEIAEFEFMDDRLYFGTWPVTRSGPAFNGITAASTLAKATLALVTVDPIADVDFIMVADGLERFRNSLDGLVEDFPFLTVLAGISARLVDLPEQMGRGDFDEASELSLITELRVEIPEWIETLDRTAALVPGNEAAVYVGPVVGEDLDFGSSSDYARVWTASNYEPDPVVAMTYGIGAMKAFNGQMYWGTMHVPFTALVAKSVIHGPAQGQQELIADFIGTLRASSYYRFDPENLLEVFTPRDPLGLVSEPTYAELLYGNPALPVFEVISNIGGTSRGWEFQPVSLGQAPTYGLSGFGNPFNNYAWSMTEFEDQLLVGTMDWSYLILPGIAPGLEPSDLTPLALIGVALTLLQSQVNALANALDQETVDLVEVSNQLDNLVGFFGFLANQLPESFPLNNGIYALLNQLNQLQTDLDNVINPPADITGLPTEAEVLEDLRTITDQLPQVLTIFQALVTALSATSPEQASQLSQDITEITDQIDSVTNLFSNQLVISDYGLQALVPSLKQIVADVRALDAGVPLLLGPLQAATGLSSVITDIELGDLTADQELDEDTGGVLQAALYDLEDALNNTQTLLLLTTQASPPLAYGADLMAFGSDGQRAQSVSINGLGNELNYGFRTMIVDSERLFIGTANPMNLSPDGGWQLFGTNTITVQNLDPAPGITSSPTVQPMPIILSYNKVGKPGDLITVTGTSLNLISEVTLGGIKAPHTMTNSQLMQFRVPEVPAGSHQLSFKLLGTNTSISMAFEVLSSEPSLVSENLDPNKKLSAGSFKGFVAIYAKGYQGARLSAKVGKDWVVVPSLKSNFVRVVEFTGAGRNLAVRIFIDRKLESTVSVRTR